MSAKLGASAKPGPSAVVLYCHCAYANVVPPAVKQAVLEGLAADGGAFEAVPDLCEMSARKDPALARLAQAPGGLVIAACYPRAVRWLFHGAGTPLPEGGVTIVNMREGSGDEALAQVRACRGDKA